MNIGDCYVERRTYRDLDDQFVLSRVARCKKLCIVEEIVIGAEQLSYDYLDKIIRRRSPNKLSLLKKFPPVKFQQLYNAIKNLYKECQQLIDSNSKPVHNHKTTAGDVYCFDGRLEFVIDYVHFYRPSWNVDFISFNENSYSMGHYRFGVNVDKYNSNPNGWLLIEQPIYDLIIEKYHVFIEALRNGIAEL